MLHWDEPEDVMNKVMMTALLAGGLMLMNSPEAAAHKEARHVYQPPAYYYYDTYRSERMPRWLRHNHSFKKWYRHSSLRRNHRIGWGELFDIYRWERRYGYRGDRYYKYERRYRDEHGRHKRGHDHRRDRRHGH